MLENTKEMRPYRIFNLYTIPCIQELFKSQGLHSWGPYGYFDTSLGIYIDFHMTSVTTVIWNIPLYMPYDRNNIWHMKVILYDNMGVQRTTRTCGIFFYPKPTFINVNQISASLGSTTRPWKARLTWSFQARDFVICFCDFVFCIGTKLNRVGLDPEALCLSRPNKQKGHITVI